jgi:hypothetical protein
MAWSIEELGFDSRQGTNDLFSSPEHPDPLCQPPIPRVRGLFPQG